MANTPINIDEYNQRMSVDLWDALGINSNRYLSAQGQSSQDWASRYTSGLGSLGGYYDQNQVNNLMGSLGSTSSNTYMNQLSALANESNRLYSYIQNPNSISDALTRKVQERGVGWINLGGNLRSFSVQNGKGYAYEPSTGRLTTVENSPIMQALYDQVNKFSTTQNSVISNLNAQQQRENSFVTQINQITQNATLTKSATEQAQQKAALEKKYAEQQAAINKTAQENAAKLAEQQRQQQAQFEAAQKAQQELAIKQQTALNETAKSQAAETASSIQSDQTRAAAVALEQQAGTVRGGEAQVSTNASDKSKRGVSTRTERWQSTRTPATGGGGVNV